MIHALMRVYWHDASDIASMLSHIKAHDCPHGLRAIPQSIMVLSSEVGICSGEAIETVPVRHSMQTWRDCS